MIASVIPTSNTYSINWTGKVQNQTSDQKDQSDPEKHRNTDDQS
jgi:hypothetical protein